MVFFVTDMKSACPREAPHQREFRKKSTKLQQIIIVIEYLCKYDEGLKWHIETEWSRERIYKNIQDRVSEKERKRETATERKHLNH